MTALTTKDLENLLAAVDAWEFDHGSLKDAIFEGLMGNAIKDSPQEVKDEFKNAREKEKSERERKSRERRHTAILLKAKLVQLIEEQLVTEAQTHVDNQETRHA